MILLENMALLEQVSHNGEKKYGTITTSTGETTSNDEILEKLKEIIVLIRPNLEKFDKSKYLAFDKGVFPKMEIKSNVKYNSITGKIIDKEE